MSLNRSKYEASSRFADLSKARCISTHFIGPGSRGTGLRNLLYQLLLGCELLIRLRKEPVTTKYEGVMTESTSALLVLGSMWMQNVTINGPSDSAARESPSSYKFVSTASQTQADALLRFGEALGWPFMDEARHCIETAYSDMATGRLDWNGDLWDWLFRLVLPGKIYRHKIMAALVFASPSARSLKAAPFYDNGLVVNGRSYWPCRTVLGRVLGGSNGSGSTMGDVKSVCGWVGPLPAPQRCEPGWIRLSARDVPIPTPVKANPGQDGLSEFGLDRTGSTYAQLERFLDPNEWIEAMPPARPPGTASGSPSKLKAIHLTKVPATAADSLPGLPPERYRASIDFDIAGDLVTYTLYSNPIFVAPPPCVGTHVLFKQRAQKHLRNVVTVSGLKRCNVMPDELLIVDARDPGEEAVARAWCSERARNAIAWRLGECCFSCTAAMADGRTGLGFNVVIMS
jgi:hypothetical protein